MKTLEGAAGCCAETRPEAGTGVGARSRWSVWKQLEGSPRVLKGELGGLAEEPAVGREDREDLGLRFQPSVARPQPGRPSAFVSSRSSLLSGT